MIGTLYFLQEGTDGAVKIGFTTGDVRVRWLSIQSGNSRELRCLGSIQDCSEVDEMRWLSRFNAFQIRGEWFHPVKALTEAILAEAAPLDCNGFVSKVRHVRPDWTLRLLDWMNERDLTSVQFAPMLGCSQQYLSSFLYGRKRVPAKIAERIEAVTEGVVRREEMRPGQAVSA